MTQNQAITKQLRRRWMTGLDALKACGTMKLATRVGEIRHSLAGTNETVIDRWVDDGDKRYKSYRIVRVCHTREFK